MRRRLVYRLFGRRAVVAFWRPFAARLVPYGVAGLVLMWTPPL